jgi:cell division protein FtsW
MAYDRWLFAAVVFLVLSGLIMVVSASSFLTVKNGLSPLHYLLVHSFHVAVGGLAFAVGMRFPYARLANRRALVWAVAGCAAALLLVLLMPAAGGAHRWFRVGPVAIQPSEIARLVALIFLADLLARREDEVDDVRRVLGPTALVVGGLAIAILVEPDLGSAFVLSAAACLLLFVAGLRWKYVWSVMAAGAIGLVGAVLLEPYRVQRVLSFLNPGDDPHDSGFQLAQSLIAVGNGGLTGTGWGQGQQKAFYLPAAHTDFIFSVIGEEVGLVGTALVLAAFSIYFWRGTRAAHRAPDRFGFYLALGITSLVVLQAFVHMGVCLGLLPTKGLPLPFVSHGGSSLVATMAASGLLLNVSQHSN